jgi:hypothetical protein
MQLARMPIRLPCRSRALLKMFASSEPHEG